MDSDISIDTVALPAELRDRDQWVCWREENREGKPTKIPVTPEAGGFASSTASETWRDIDTALEYATTEHADGIGFVFTDDDPLVGVDLDDCRDPETGAVDEEAQDIIERLDSYTEVSPSGTGYHVLITGDLPEGRNRRGDIELYDTARFFTVTGDSIEEKPDHVARRQDALVAIHREYVRDSESNEESDVTEQGAAEEQSETTDSADVDVTLANEELLEKARNASNGSKFEQLWNGNTAGYDSQSEADMALCCLLAFWTGGDQRQMDALFRESGLLREKWDEVHYADGSTYGEKTIERAISNTSEFYDPDTSGDTTDTADSAPDSKSDGDATDSDRSRTYLVEKNRLLTERIEELEAALEEKTDGIETLEAEIERLTDELARRAREPENPHEVHTIDAGEHDDESETRSIWSRTKRLFGSDSENNY